MGEGLLYDTGSSQIYISTILGLLFMVFNATVINISVILWRSFYW